MTMHRRDVLKSGLAGLAGLAFPSTLARAARARVISTPNGRRLILLPMRGGFDGLHMFPPVDPVAYAGFHLRRPTLAITDQTLALNDGTGLAFHPLMPRLKAAYDNGECALGHQVGWPGPNGSHFVSQDRNASARADSSGHDSGWMVRAAEHFNMTTTETIATGVGSVLDVRQSPGSAYRPLSLGNVDDFVLPENPNDLADPMSIERNQAGEDAEGHADPDPGSVAELFHIANESAYQLVEAVQAGLGNYNGPGIYTPSSFGKNMLGLARLISVTLGMPAAYDIPLLGLTFGGGFDTHGNQKSRMDILMDDVDINLQAFIDDLKWMNQFNDTVIAFYTEFGRRIAENGNQGTDHGEGNNVLLIGGCINGGNHYGNVSTPMELRNLPNVPVSMDFRHLFETLLGSWLGATPNDVMTIIDDPSDVTLRPDLSTLFNC